MSCSGLSVLLPLGLETALGAPLASFLKAALGLVHTHPSPEREGPPRLQSTRSKIGLGHQPLTLLPWGGERQLAAPAPPEQDTTES